MPSNLRRLGNKAASVFVATLCTALLQWIIMTVVARQSGAVTLGSFALAQAYVTPLSYLSWLSIRQQFLVSKLGRGTPADFLALRLTIPAIVFALALLAIWGLDRSIDLPVFVAVFLMRYVEGWFDLLYGGLQQANLYRALAWTSLWRFLASLALLGLLVTIGMDTIDALLIVSLSWIPMFYLQRRQWGLFPSPLRTLALIGKRGLLWIHLAVDLLPLGISLVLMSLVVSLPRIIVEFYLGPRELGLFAAIYHFIAIGSILIGSIGHALLPALASTIARRDRRDFWSKLLGLAAFIAAACGAGSLLALAIGSPLVELLYGHEFAGQGQTLAVAAAAAAPLFASSIMTNGLYAAQLKMVMNLVQGTTLVVLGITTAMLVNYLGVTGAFLAMMTAGLYQVTISAILLLNYWRRLATAAPLQTADSAA